MRCLEDGSRVQVSASPDAPRTATEEQLRLAMHAARMVVLGLDAELRVTWGHAPGADGAAEPAGLLDVLAAGQAPRLIELARAAAASGQRQHAELELVLDGEHRTYDFQIEPVCGGVMAVGLDVTPARRRHAELLAADRRKDEFLAMLAHELRNPLAPLRIALEVARLGDQDAGVRARTRAIMERQIGQLTRLVDDLLDLSRIIHDKLELERVLLDPVDVVSTALEGTSSLIDDRKHRLEVRIPESPVRVAGDFHRLVQVVTNLLTNAAKYTPAGGRIELALGAVPERGVLAIGVRDTGIGIPEEVLPNIFDLFVQAHDARKHSHRGLGVGLNLVRRIVELHGGTVRAASAGTGQGSEFVIELPIAEEPGAPA
ncbi:MAG TPA: ATP-binding protein [Kofleriaceae bacterium]|nr:ATP-binding protein [Kofleriaceae bacterium]